MPDKPTISKIRFQDVLNSSYSFNYPNQYIQSQWNDILHRVSNLNNRKHFLTVQSIRQHWSSKNAMTEQRGQDHNYRQLQGKRQNANVMVMVHILWHMVQAMKNFWLTVTMHRPPVFLPMVAFTDSSCTAVGNIWAQSCHNSTDMFILTQNQIRNTWLIPLPFFRQLAFLSGWHSWVKEKSWAMQLRIFVNFVRSSTDILELNPLGKKWGLEVKQM